MSKLLYNRYINFEKVFDSTEHKEIFKTPRTINFDGTYVVVLHDIFTGATSRVHINKV